MSPPRKSLPYLLVLVTTVLALFWPALHNQNLILINTFDRFSDILVIHWPKAHLLAQSWQAGEGLPHWTPLILGGMPLAANQLAMLAYPPAWLFAVFPVEPVFNALFIFHLLLGGIALYFLLREAFGALPGAALVGGLAFALNGKWLAHAAGGHVSLVGAVAWMAWAVLGMHLLLRELAASQRWFSARLAGWALLTTGALAMQITTHTLPLLYSTYLLAAMAVFFGFKRPDGGAQKPGFWNLTAGFWYLAAILALAAMLGAGQLLPLLELAPYSNRALTPAQAAEFSLSPAQLLAGLLLPSAHAGHEFVIYPGLVALLLAPLGITRKNRWSWFYAGVLAFAILFALGPATPLHGLFYRFAPGFGWVRTPARIFFVGAIAVSVLAGLAADRLARETWSPEARRWLLRAALGGGLLTLLLGLGLALMFGQANRAALGLAIFAPATLAVAALRAHHKLPASWTLALLAGLVIFDLASFDAGMMKFISRDTALAPGREAAAALANKPGPFRVYSPSYSLPMQTAAAFNLHLADGVEPVHLAVVDQFMARAGGYGDSGFSVTVPHFNGPPDTALQAVEPNLKLLGLLNVKYLAAEFPMKWEGLTPETQAGSTFIYRNRLALPRAWVAYQTRPTQSNWLAQLESLPDVQAVALVEADAPTPNTPRPASAAEVTHFTPDKIRLAAATDAPGWLVLSEIWYPGWTATVDGAPAPVARVDGLLRGVYLPNAGTHNISVEYRPASVIWGGRLAWATLLAIVATTGIWAARATFRPKKR